MHVKAFSIQYNVRLEDTVTDRTTRHLILLLQHCLQIIGCVTTLTVVAMNTAMQLQNLMTARLLMQSVDVLCNNRL